MQSFTQKPQKPLHYRLAMEKKKPKVHGEYLVSIKKDGWFVCSDYDPITKCWTPLKSFAQREVPSMRHIDLNKMNINTSHASRIIFEATIPGISFYEANGIFNRKQELALDTELWLHDFVQHGRAVPAQERWKSVEMLHAVGKFKTVPVFGVSSDHSQWLRWFENAVEQGEEGIVLKRMNSFYSPSGRNEDLLKIKLEVTKDLLCTRIERTWGKKGEPSLNAVLVSKAGIEITVVIPKDSDQILFENDPSRIVGKVVEVRAMKENEEGTLREPRFKGVRNDKDASEID